MQKFLENTSRTAYTLWQIIFPIAYLRMHTFLYMLQNYFQVLPYMHWLCIQLHAYTSIQNYTTHMFTHIHI